MKILFLSDLNSIHTKKWIKAISEHGVELLAFGLAAPIDDFYEKLDNVSVCSSNFKNQYGSTVFKKARYFKVFGALKKACNDFKPDIVHAHYATSYGVLGALLNYKPFVISVWGEDVFSFPRESWLKKEILKWNFKRASLICSTSKVMAVETSKYTQKEVSVVPFGVDTSFFKPITDLKRDNLTIGIVKTLEDKYGISYLIDAFSKLVDQYDGLKLLIVGSGSKSKDLKNQVISLGINECVTFTGKVPHDQVPLYFNKMDVVVVPSVVDGESFGVAAVEASACARPVIVSNIGGLPEVVIDGVTGVITEPANSEKLAAKIKLLLDRYEWRIKLGLAGRQNVEENYNWSDNVNLMIQHYNRML